MNGLCGQLRRIHCRACLGADRRTLNQYSRSRLRRERLAAYWTRASALDHARGGSAGYRGGARQWDSLHLERQLTGSGPAEASATIVHRVLAESGSRTRCCSGTSSRHIHTRPDRPYLYNRRPTRGEVEASARFLEGVARGRLVIAVGRARREATGRHTCATRPWRRATRFGRVLARRFKRFVATIPPRRTACAPLLRMATSTRMQKTWNAKAGRGHSPLVRRRAEGQTLGRLATRIADTLRGKGKAEYTPHSSTPAISSSWSTRRRSGHRQQARPEDVPPSFRLPGGASGAVRCASSSSAGDEGAAQGGQGHASAHRLSRAQIGKLKIYVGRSIRTRRRARSR